MEELIKELCGILEHKFDVQLIKKIFTFTLPAIQLKPVFGSDGIDIGQSKIGGVPDLPAGEPWPIGKHNPLSFLLQINLADTALFQLSQDLPKQGFLSFFYDVEEQPWGFDPKDRGGWKVLYFDSTKKLLRRECSHPKVVQFRNGTLKGEKKMILPPANPVYLREFGFTKEQTDCYSETLETMQEGMHHWLLGHPAEIQGEMRLQVQLAANGFYCGNTIDLRDPKAAELAKTAQHWRLLLQVDSDEGAEMMWGDCGRLYFWIHHKDLLACNFDNVWVVLQCG